MTFRSMSRLPLFACAVTALYACSGSSGATPSAAPAPANASMAPNGGLPPGVTPQMVALGDSIFKNGSCKNCHGPDAKGTVKGPDLTDDKWSQIPTGSYAEIVQIVTSGVPKDKIKMAGAPFGMNPRGGGRPPLTDDQVAAVAAYVYTLSHH